MALAVLENFQEPEVLQGYGAPRRLGRSVGHNELRRGAGAVERAVVKPPRGSRPTGRLPNRGWGSDQRTRWKSVRLLSTPGLGACRSQYATKLFVAVMPIRRGGGVPTCNEPRTRIPWLPSE